MTAPVRVHTAHLPLPRPVDVVTPHAAEDIREAQASIGVGFDRALRNLRLCGFNDDQTVHVVRIVALGVLSGFDQTTVSADRALVALVDRLEREGWLSGVRR